MNRIVLPVALGPRVSVACAEYLADLLRKVLEDEIDDLEKQGLVGKGELATGQPLLRVNEPPMPVGRRRR